jgi:Flp pilus assembly protein TadD
VAAFLAVRGVDADSALTATERALRSGPESAALRNNRGIALLRSGDAEAARAEFARAIALDPARPGPYYNLAILERFYRMDTEAAKRWFQEAWSRSHADPDSLRPELGGKRPATVAEGSRER